MSSTPDADSLASLHARVAAIEAALALPAASPAATSPASQELRATVAALEKQLVKQEYRIAHLVKAYDAHVAEIADLRAQLRK